MDNIEQAQVKPRSGAVRKVRDTITDTPTTIAEIVQRTELKAEQVSMSLCHLLKRNFVEREQINRTGASGRKMVWAYRLKSPPPLNGV